ncbi:17003_t:CDS:2 [Entrophospora sp. SA101]|nr:12764_t:CDS:2 [Entrophospora sp. SA101]CAJ0762007.1 17003_t:CDS:2 [Entrophospora sp. SA101]CAJ0833067.1 1070_t:CDS:2 [Entrophospora sp. SA101]CAJ0902166.1 13403_t:CDS:2 [Entrophospora sp. SA101]
MTKQFNLNTAELKNKLEPWQRGLALIGIAVFLIFAIYYLTRESQDRQAQRKLKAEQALEERMLRRMETLKKLRE